MAQHDTTEVFTQRRGSAELRTPEVRRTRWFAAFVAVAMGALTIHASASPRHPNKRADSPNIPPRLQAQIGHTSGVVHMAWSPEGRTLASIGDDKSLKLWETETGRLRASLRADTESLFAVVWRSDGRLVATSGAEGVKVWDAGSGELFATAYAEEILYDNAARQISWSADGRALRIPDVGLWDVETRAMRRLSDEDATRVQDGVSPDGRLYAEHSGSDLLDGLTTIDELTNGDGVVVVRDVATQHVVATLQSRQGPVRAIEWSPDTRWLLTFEYQEDQDLAIVWDTATWQQRIAFSTPRDRGAVRVWAPDASALAVSTSGSRLTLFDTATWRPRAVLENPGTTIVGAAWRPDARSLVVLDRRSGSLPARALLLNPATGQIVGRLETPLTLQLASLTGAPVEGPIEYFTAAAWSPDGTNLAFSDYDGNILVWDPANASIRRTLTRGSEAQGQIAWVAGDGAPAISVATGRERSLWRFDTGSPESLADRLGLGAGDTGESRIFWSPTGESVLLLGGAASRLIDGRTGTPRATLPVDDVDIPVHAWSEDGASLAARGRRQSVLLVDARTGRVHATLPSVAGAISCPMAWSPSGAFVASGHERGVIQVWDARLMRRASMLRTGNSAVSALAWSADGATLASGSEDGIVRFWATDSWRQRASSDTDRDTPIVDLFWTSDSATVVSRSSEPHNSEACIWDPATGALRGELDVTMFLNQLAFSSTANLIATGGREGAVRLWDPRTGQLLAAQRLGAEIRELAFSRDGRFLVTSSDDGVLSLHRIDRDAQPDGRRLVPLCSMVWFQDGTWSVIAPDGRFDTNDLEQVRGIHWVLPDDGLRTLPIEIFSRQYYEPRLLARLVAGEAFEPIPSIATLNPLQPRVRIASIERQGDSGRATVRVEVSGARVTVRRGGVAAEAVTGAYDLRLFRDGQMVGTAPAEGMETLLDADDVASWRAATRVAPAEAVEATVVTFRDVRIPLRVGPDGVEFSAYAFNEDRVKSATDRKTLAVGPAARVAKGRAYILSVGVNAYDDPKLDLKFAANDARSVAATLADRLVRTGQFERVTSILLVSERGGPQLATKGNVKAVLDRLAGRNADTSLLGAIPNSDGLEPARPADFVVVSFAGHGYAGAGGRFYVVPSDVGAGARAAIGALAGQRGLALGSSATTTAGDVLRRCISSDELSVWLRDVDAGDFAMIVDACQSGALAGEGFKPGPMGSRGLGQLAYDKGMRILAATQADNVALEVGRLEHGLLTYALIQNGIEAGQADYRPKDRIIALNEWLSYGEARVPDLAAEIAARKIRNFGGEAPRILVHENDTDARPLQRPILFDFGRGRRRAPVIESR